MLPPLLPKPLRSRVVPVATTPARERDVKSQPTLRVLGGARAVRVSDPAAESAMKSDTTRC